MQPRELEVVRHVLAGDSVVDWRGLEFASHADVDAVLRLNKLDWHSPRDARYLKHLLAESVHFLVEALRQTGFPVVSFAGGEKSREALVLKLLAKRETLAAQVYDKIRFRLVVEEVDDIPAIVLHLTQHLFPFNYVIPGQSQNEIVAIPSAESDSNDRPMNESSGPTYKHLDFVVDLPLRIDPFASLEQTPELERLGSVVYAMVEFQVVDRKNALANESGQNSHDAYKERQKERVLERLERPFEE